MTREECADLIQRYSKALIRYAASILKDVETAREVVQECFIKVLNFQLSAIKIPSWLYREVRNRSIDIWRHRRKIENLEPEREENLMSGHPNPLEGLEVRQDLALVSEFLHGLSKRDQEILRLKYGEGLSYEEIGETLGLTATNVGYILCQAVKSLREQYGNRTRS